MVLLAMTILGCARQPAPLPMADSTATANSVRRMEGKHFRVFSGPAEILGDTTKNERNPLIRR